MGKPHAIFHRRAAGASSVLTVNVEVVNTVDPNGVVISQETLTPHANDVMVAQETPPPVPQVPQVPTVPIPPVPSLPTVPAVPPVPTVAMPTVPAVPQFPSDFTVPGYPFTSSPPSSASSAPDSSSQALVTATSSPSAASSAAITTTAPTSSSVDSSTASSSVIPSSALSSLSSISSTISSSTQSTSTSQSSTTPSSSTVFISSSASSSTSGGVGGVNPTSSASPEASHTAEASDKQSVGSGALGTPQVIGTVFGSLVAAAVILALLLFLIKRHKRKQDSALRLTGDDSTDNQPMTQAAARQSYVAPSFLNRFSGASRATTSTASTGERGFHRVSGRKLPSAFSEGMTSEQFARGESVLSGSSFYKDEKGFYGGPGVIPKDFAFAKETEDPVSHSGIVGTKERVMPSPARTPTIHHPDEDDDLPPFGTNRNGGGSTLSPPLTPNPDYHPRGTLGRSHPSQDGSRSSRFTERLENV